MWLLLFGNITEATTYNCIAQFTGSKLSIYKY